MAAKPSRTVRNALRTIRNGFRTVRDVSTMPVNPSRTVRLRLRGKLRGDGIVRGAAERIDILPRQERIGSILLCQEVTMTQKEYEERRRALEQELEADLALIHAAHEARLRSLDRLRQLATEGNEPGAVSGPFTAAPNRPATPRDAVPPPAAVARKPARPPGAFLNDLDAVLSRLPEVFDKKDVTRLLGYEPTPSTFHRALTRLQREGAVAVEEYSDGGVHTVYRRLRGSPPDSEFSS
jgi:hypothetical protein